MILHHVHHFEGGHHLLNNFHLKRKKTPKCRLCSSFPVVSFPSVHFLLFNWLQLKPQQVGETAHLHTLAVGRGHLNPTPDLLLPSKSHPAILGKKQVKPIKIPCTNLMAEIVEVNALLFSSFRILETPLFFLFKVKKTICALATSQ